MAFPNNSTTDNNPEDVLQQNHLDFEHILDDIQKHTTLISIHICQKRGCNKTAPFRIYRVCHEKVLYQIHILLTIN